MEADQTQQRSPKRRARIVCHRCHERKTRCDLQSPGATCSACLDAAATCKFRPSYRGHYRRKTGRQHERTEHLSANKIPAEVEAEPCEKTSVDRTTNGNYIRALLGHQAQLRGTQHNYSSIHADGDVGHGIMRTYLETYLAFHFAYCPVLDIDDTNTTLSSLLLNHTLASIMSMIKPSLMPGAQTSTDHYERARDLFYNERKHNVLSMVQAALLFSYHNSSEVSSPMDSSFWWLGVAIRLAQDMRLHRVSRASGTLCNAVMQRRIWWTLFARERILALFQGRPSSINENDCSTELPKVDDFPEHLSRQGRLFVHWVYLSRIMGDVNKQMLIARRVGISISTESIATSLVSWLHSVSDDFQLPIQNAYTAPFSQEVHTLYLPYLTTVALMYLNTTGQDIPEVSVAAVLAASCIARIAGDILHRGISNTLSEDCGWFFAIAISALMHLHPIAALAKHAAADIWILRAALGSLCDIWSSAKILQTGLDKILEDHASVVTINDSHVQDKGESLIRPLAPFSAAGIQSIQDLFTSDGVQWAEFFPFATAQTSPLIEAFLLEYQDNTWLEAWPAFDFDLQSLWSDFDAGRSTLLGNVQ